MRVIVCCPTPSLTMSLCLAASVAGLEAEAEPSLQEFGSLLFRDPDAIGVLWSIGEIGAAETICRLQQADIRSMIMVLVEEPKTSAKSIMIRSTVLLAGADDIQPLPIDDREFVARLAALGRRVRMHEAAYSLPNGCTFDPGTGELRNRDGAIVGLSGHEAKLLDALAARPGMVCSKAMLFLALYEGRADDPQAKIIDVFICKIRRKIAAITGGLDCIETVWGDGYRFCEEGYEPVARLARKAVLA